MFYRNNLMTPPNQPDELQKAIETALEAQQCAVNIDSLYIYCHGQVFNTILSAAKQLQQANSLLNDGRQLLTQKWNILLPEIEMTFTHKANLNTVRLERDEFELKLQQVEKESGGRIDLARGKLALNHQNIQLRQENDSLKAALEKCAIAVQKNHKWHQDYDEYDGYPECDLCQTNLNALSDPTVQAVLNQTPTQ